LTYGDGEREMPPADTLFERLRGRLFGAALQRRIDFLMLCGFSRLRNSKDVRCWLMHGLASSTSLADGRKSLRRLAICALEAARHSIEVLDALKSR